MGGEVLGQSFPRSIKSYTDLFYEVFPFYLAIGMPSGEYWEGDCALPQYYRRAYTLKQEQANSSAWLQGLYFYDAVGALLGTLFAPKGAPAKTYVERPFSWDAENIEHEKRLHVQAEQAKAKAWLNAWVTANQGRNK